MYEDAMDLANSRSKDIQNDQHILQQLSTSSLSIPEAWDQIVHIRNGAIRYAACNSFLNEEIGKGEVRQAGDIKVVYSAEDITIIFPGGAGTKKQISVIFDKLSCLVSNPNSDTDPLSKEELATNAYVSLLRKNGAIPDRVRLRGPEGNELWSDLNCYLYYFFILHPSDIIHGRSELSYWEAQQEADERKRQAKKKEQWLAWYAQRQQATVFNEMIYKKLLLFGIPIFIQFDQMQMPAENFLAFVNT